MPFHEKQMLSLVSTVLTVLLVSVSCFGASPNIAQDFEKEDSQPKVWVVGIPNENASVELSTDHPAEGKQCAKLHYHFSGQNQYLGVTVPLKIEAVAHKLQYQLHGDNSGCNYGVYVLDASGETHKFPAGKIDFSGWKQQTVNLDGSHEIWGGDKNRKIDYPISEIVFEVGTPGKEIEGDLYYDAVTTDGKNAAGTSSQTAAPAVSNTSGVAQDFETDASQPKVWVVGIPNENASVELSTDHPVEGKQCAKLHYHFTGQNQYLGVTVPVNIETPIHTLRYQLYGDNSGCNYGVYVMDASGETHKFKSGKVDFTGWKQKIINLDGSHEIWGGDKNRKIDYPVSEIVFEVGTPGKEINSNLYYDAVVVDMEKVMVPTISVLSPEYCSDVKGDTRIDVSAAGFKSITAKCWKQGDGFGADSEIAKIDLDAEGKGSFVFPADQYPHGPITLRISADNGDDKDNCYLQLYNKGGVSWKEGLPDAPPAAKGLSLIFADDFDGPLSIGETADDRYYDHKPPRGAEDFSSIPFTSHDKPNTPFAQRETYLRIRASEENKSAGLISSIKPDASGIMVSAPCYFECRFIGPNAIGSWPAFWLMTDYMTHYDQMGKRTPVDELDIIEAYGGEGPGHPNADDRYMIAPHRWNQGEEADAMAKAASKSLNNPCRMRNFGIPSTWFESFHTYGCKVTETETIYYCDDIEVARHATFPLCKEKPLFFMINLATGGGWPVDLSRYNGTADMYVDYVRVYGKK